jgi:hypothetical protein
VLSQNYISGTNMRVDINVVSVMVAYFDLLCVCTHDTHIGTRYVILAKHCTWLPDDGFM